MPALRRAQVIGVQALRASALLAEVLTLSRVATTGLDRVDLREIAAVALVAMFARLNYYALAGQKLRPPKSADATPDPELLAWHSDTVFQAA